MQALAGSEGKHALPCFSCDLTAHKHAMPCQAETKVQRLTCTRALQALAMSGKMSQADFAAGAKAFARLWQDGGSVDRPWTWQPTYSIFNGNEVQLSGCQVHLILQQ